MVLKSHCDFCDVVLVDGKGKGGVKITFLEDDETYDNEYKEVCLDCIVKLKRVIAPIKGSQPRPSSIHPPVYRGQTPPFADNTNMLADNDTDEYNKRMSSAG